MRSCLQCGESLFGRSDKKFCNDFCRNTYNNNLNKENVEVIRITNNKLKKNHKILRSLAETKKSSITRSELELLGFDFNLVTSFDFSDGIIYRKVYDFILKQNQDNQISLHQIAD